MYPTSPRDTPDPSWSYLYNRNLNVPNTYQYQANYPRSIWNAAGQLEGIFLPGELGKIRLEMDTIHIQKKFDFDSELEPIREKCAGQNCCTENKRICWWNPNQESLPIEFSRNTSLHGLKFIGQPKRHLSERIFWIVSFLIGVSTATLLITDCYVKFSENPLIVSFLPVETRVREIPFPAITICNMNKVQRSKAEKFMTDANLDDNTEESRAALQNVYYVNHVCSTSNSFSKRFNYSISRGKINGSLLGKIAELHYDEGENLANRNRIKDFFTVGSQTCPNMIPFCTWRDRERYCPDIIRPVETDFGKCCTFNMVPQTLIHRFLNDSRDNITVVEQWANSNLNIDDLLLEVVDENGEQIMKNGSKFPRRVSRAGKSFGLSILIQPDIDEYFCTTSDSTGFRLAVHLPIEVPHIVDSGIGIAPNSEIFINLTPDVTIASKDIRSFPINKRLCYLRDEYALKYYTFYTASNCIDECISNRTYEKCNCVRYFMPRDDLRQLCEHQQFNCTDFVKREFTDTPIKEFCGQCYPTCTEISYATLTTSTTLQNPSDVSGSGSDDLDYLSSSHKNASIVHVFFGEEAFYPKIRKQLYDSTDLIANTGSLLSLCLGFSGLSAIELIYFITLHFWCKYRRNRAKLFVKMEDRNNSTRVFSNLRSRRIATSGRLEELKDNRD